MDIHIANTLIYLKGHSDEAIRQGVERSLRRDPGVVSVGLPSGREHLVMVGFDPAVTNSLNLIHRAESSGIHARLVGF